MDINKLKRVVYKKNNCRLRQLDLENNRAVISCGDDLKVVDPREIEFLALKDKGIYHANRITIAFRVGGLFLFFNFVYELLTK